MKKCIENCIFRLISHTAYEKLDSGEKFQRLHDIPCRLLLQPKDEPTQKLGVHLVGKKAILCVNVASTWGLTEKSYKELAQIYTDLGPRGLQILAFPSNTFNQEKGSEEDLKLFQEKRGVEYPVFEKIEVNGKNSHEVFQFLRSHAVDLQGPDGI